MRENLFSVQFNCFSVPRVFMKLTLFLKPTCSNKSVSMSYPRASDQMNRSLMSSHMLDSVGAVNSWCVLGLLIIQENQLRLCPRNGVLQKPPRRLQRMFSLLRKKSVDHRWVKLRLALRSSRLNFLLSDTSVVVRYEFSKALNKFLYENRGDTIKKTSVVLLRFLLCLLCFAYKHPL